MNTSFNITYIEEGLTTIIKSLNITQKVLNNRPKADMSVSDFIVVKVSGGVDDLATYATAYIGVHLFAKDVQGLKNTAKLSYLYNSLVAGIPPEYKVTRTVEGQVEELCSVLVDAHPNVVGDVPDDYGFHARILNFQVTIKSL